MAPFLISTAKVCPLPSWNCVHATRSSNTVMGFTFGLSRSPESIGPVRGERERSPGLNSEARSTSYGLRGSPRRHGFQSVANAGCVPEIVCPAMRRSPSSLTTSGLSANLP